MRKLWIAAILGITLCGCSQTEHFETMLDPSVTPDPGQKMQIMLDLPDQAVLEVMESDQDHSIYICDDYTLTVSTVAGGDLQNTVLDATGFVPEQLDGIMTQEGDLKKYVCVWASVADSGQQIGRCAVIDDGNYHYVLTALADAEKAGALAKDSWQSVFRSFRLIHPDDVVNSGS